jgi:hypothetical protein
LRALSATGIDEVLQRIADHFGFDGLTLCHLSVIAVNRCENGEIHVDATNTAEKVLSAIIPIILAKETIGPESKNLSKETIIGIQWEKKSSTAPISIL